MRRTRSGISSSRALALAFLAAITTAPVRCLAQQTASGSATATNLIAVAATVTAGTETTATIAAGDFFGAGDADDVRAIEVFLAVGNDTDVARSSSFTQSQCWLIQSLPVCGTPGITVHADHISFANFTFAFTVPPAAGPSALQYALRAQVLLTDGTVYLPSGGGSGNNDAALLSNAFALQGGTGRSELFVFVEVPPAYVPCTSYGCVFGCLGELFGANASASAAACVDGCAGVAASLPPGFFASEVTAGVAPTQRPATTIAGTGCVVQAAQTSAAAGSASNTAAGSSSTSAANSTSGASASNQGPGLRLAGSSVLYAVMFLVLL